MGTAAHRAVAIRRLRRHRVHIFGQPPKATQNVDYTYTVDIRGGKPTYVLSIVGGTLPAGLSVVGGTITGTPTVLGNSDVFLRVVDGGGVATQKKLSFGVVA